VDNSKRRPNGEQALTGSPSVYKRPLTMKILEAANLFSTRISNRHAQIALHVGCRVQDVAEALASVAEPISSEGSA